MPFGNLIWFLVWQRCPHRRPTLMGPFDNLAFFACSYAIVATAIDFTDTLLLKGAICELHCDVTCHGWTGGEELAATES